MNLRKRAIKGRGLALILLLMLAVACSPTNNPQATPQVVTATPLSHTPVPTFDRYETPTPSPEPTQPLIIRDALTGNGDSLYVRNKPSTMGTITQQVNADDAVKLSYIGRSDDSRWLQATLSDGSTGWIMARAITLPQDISKLPVTATAENVDYVALVSPEAKNGIPMYDNPNNTTTPLATLPALTPVR